MLYKLLVGNKLGSSGFVPLPYWMRRFFQRFSKLRQLQIYVRLVNGVSFWKDAPADLACAESVTRICQVLFGTPVILGTWTLLEYLDNSNEWMELAFPVSGSIIIAATGTGYAGTIGHVGICDDEKVWSNNSDTGKWGDYYTVRSFKMRYNMKQGMRVRYFIIK